MNYSKIDPCDSANGEGWRTSLFVSGCQFHCPDCFNQEAQSYDYGKRFTNQTFKDILKFVSKPQIQGLSILGGDPLWQNSKDMKTLTKLCQSVKALNKNIWIWSGFVWEHLDKDQMQFVSSCDVFVDGRFVKELKDLGLAFRGSTNQRIIDVKQSQLNHCVMLYHD